MLNLDEVKFENEVTQNSGFVFVDYWSPSCGPCNTLAPIFASLESEFSDRIKFAKLNTDQSSNLCISQHISALPTLILYKNGVEIDRFLGLRSENFIKDFLNKYLS